MNLHNQCRQAHFVPAVKVGRAYLKHIVSAANLEHHQSAVTTPVLCVDQEQIQPCIQVHAPRIR